MNWNALRAKLQHAHLREPQKAMICDLALRTAEAALADLARAGHHFRLVEGHEHPAEFPKMMYHLAAEPHLCLCEADVAELGLGWYDSPWDAQLAEAYEVQFEGKGGVPRPRKAPVVAGPRMDDWSPNWDKIKSDFLKAKELRNGTR